jgi:hypothetical protein
VIRRINFFLTLISLPKAGIFHARSWSSKRKGHTRENKVTAEPKHMIPFFFTLPVHIRNQKRYKTSDQLRGFPTLGREGVHMLSMGDLVTIGGLGGGVQNFNCDIQHFSLYLGDVRYRSKSEILNESFRWTPSPLI